MGTIKHVSARDNAAFAEALDISLLAAIEFIAQNYTPEEIFDQELLIEWAEQQNPVDIYGNARLHQWAIEDGGYVEHQ